ncbi:MAG: hypothetical protein RLZZ117_772 [Cyanobacteriota bacterium]
MATPRPDDLAMAARPEGFWQHKPWWCQPWTIVLTGVLALALDALLYLRFSLPLWLVAPPALAILSWWLLFLWIVPNAAPADHSH